MAYHTLFLKNEKEFYSLLEDRDPDLVLKMVKCILNGIKHKRNKIDVFDITFKESNDLIFSLDKTQFNVVLGNCIKDLEEMEQYELCADVKKVLDKKPAKKAK